MGQSDPGTVRSGEFLCHGLMNDLTIIIGVCDLLQEELPGNSIASGIRLIREAAVRTLGQVEDIEIVADGHGH
jgi:hypothetical protein